LYALSLILSKTWNGPSPLGCNFDFLWLWNHSLHMCTQTQSAGWKTTYLHLLFDLGVYNFFLFSICSWTPSWSCLTIFAFFSPSKFTLYSKDKEIKSIRVSGLNS
jgi:hypothetical protein